MVLPPLGQANQQHLARFERDRGCTCNPYLATPLVCNGKHVNDCVCAIPTRPFNVQWETCNDCVCVCVCVCASAAAEGPRGLEWACAHAHKVKKNNVNAFFLI